MAATSDSKGNLTTDPVTASTYGYSSENLLTAATVSGSAVTVAYDPLMRMIQATGSLGPIRFA